MITLREHDPTLTCPRRPKGQITCSELSCDQCHIFAMDLTSASSPTGLGSLAMLFAWNLTLHDRHTLLGRCHGMILPTDIDWRQVGTTPTGEY